MRIAESRMRRIIREEIEDELNEQGFLSNLAAGAKGAVTGAVQGAVGGGISGALQGAVGGAQAGVAANRAVTQAADALRKVIAFGHGPQFMSKMDQNSLSMYLTDWNGTYPVQVSRAMWATLKLITIERERFQGEFYPAVGRALSNSPELNNFADAVSAAAGVGPGDPRWLPTLADAIVSNKIV